MAAGATYTPIATTTLGSNVQSVTFSSIPSTYTDLVLVGRFSAVTGGQATMHLQFNGDTNTNYSYTLLQGNGTNAISARATSTKGGTFGGIDGVPTSQCTSIAHIQNYSNSTTYKTYLNRYSDSAKGVETSANLWRATPAAINQVLIYIGYDNGTYVDNIASGSTFTLYGITAA